MIMMYIGCVYCPVYFVCIVYCVMCVLPCPAPSSIHYKANTGGVSPHMNTKAPSQMFLLCACIWCTMVYHCRHMQNYGHQTVFSSVKE